MQFQLNNFKSLIFRNIPIISILILALVYRLYKIADYMTFLGDEGRDVLAVYNILHGKLTLLGPTSSVGGFFLGPIYYYFMAPFLLIFNYNPVGPAVMVALFGIATVWLLYRVTSEILGKNAAIFASLLYAISPLVVSYSRSSWNPNLMPFFTLLCLYTLYKGVLKNKYLYFLITGALYGILMQLHYIEFFVGGIIFLYLLITQFLKKDDFKKQIFLLFKKYLLILTGFVIGFSPFLAFEARHGFPNTQSIVKFIFNSPNVSSNGGIINIIGEVFFRLFARLVANFPPPEQIVNYSKDAVLLWTIEVMFLAVTSFGFFLYKFYESLRKNDEKKPLYLLIVLWFIVGVLLFGFYKKPIYDYYFQFLFPLPFILVGNLIGGIYKYKNSINFKIIALLIFGIIFVLNLYGIPFRYPPNRQLNQMKTIADFVMTRTDAKPFNFALITGGNSDHAYRYFFTIWNHPPITIEHGSENKTVTDQLFIVCESLPCEPLGHSLWEIAGFGRAEIAGKWKVSVVEVYKLVHYKGQ